MSGPVRKGLSNILKKDPSDIVILSSLRTPITRSYKGHLKDAYPEELLATVLRATISANPNLDPALIQDVGIGVVLSELGGSKAGRMAMNHVGIPTSTSFYTVNRACSSGLSAITNVSHQIATGMIDIGVGGGMESMTRNYGSKAIPTVLWPELRDSPVKNAKDCIMPMGLTSENVAERYGVSRADQDAFAVMSHQRAATAQAEGLFDKEIVPVHTRYQEKNKAGENVGEEQQITVTKDDGIRTNASIEGMTKLKPAFKENGTSTAGNSSQISDGAAATLLMRRSTATELGLTSSIIGHWAGTQVAGCAPDEMGIGPAIAIPKLLEYTGLTAQEVGLWEINEAFASQAIYCVRKLGLEKRLEEGRVNPKGGAIALGHPLGATGARMLAGLLPEMERQGLETGVVSMCIGTGMGMAGLFVPKFLATNTDSTLPNSYTFFPGAGSISIPLVNMIGEKPLALGKPSQAMMDSIEGKFQFDRKKACMVGDRLDTDIKFGIEGKLGGTLAVLTGVSKKADWEVEGAEVAPAYYVEKLSDLRG